MTLVELMDAVKAEIDDSLKGNPGLADLEGGPIVVYSGFPYQRTSAKRIPSYIYCMVVNWSDSDNPDQYSTAEVEIGFSIEDPDIERGFMSLVNCMEHVRQRLLQKRILRERHSLQLPLKGNIPTQQPASDWIGTIRATYTLGQPADFGAEYVYE